MQSNQACIWCNELYSHRNDSDYTLSPSFWDEKNPDCINIKDEIAYFREHGKFSWNN